MEISVAAVADHAWVEGGCLSMCRTIDTVYARKFPHFQPRLSIALRVLLDRSEAGVHKIAITLADVDGKKVMATQGEVNVQKPPGRARKPAFTIALNGQGVKFPTPGEYTVDFVIDGRLRARIPLYLRRRQPVKK